VVHRPDSGQWPSAMPVLREKSGKLMGYFSGAVRIGEYMLPLKTKYPLLSRDEKIRRLRSRCSGQFVSRKMPTIFSSIISMDQSVGVELVGFLLGLGVTYLCTSQLYNVIGAYPDSNLIGESLEKDYHGRDIWIDLDLDCPFSHKASLEVSVMHEDGMLLMATIFAKDQHGRWSESAYRKKMSLCRSIEFSIEEIPRHTESKLQVSATSGFSVGSDFTLDDDKPDPFRSLAELVKKDDKYKIGLRDLELQEIARRGEGGHFSFTIEKATTKYSYSVRQVQISFVTKSLGLKTYPVAQLSIGLASHLTAISVFPEPDLKDFGVLVSEYSFGSDARRKSLPIRRAYVTYQDRFLQKLELAKTSFWSVLLGVGVAMLFESTLSIIRNILLKRSLSPIITKRRSRA